MATIRQERLAYIHDNPLLLSHLILNYKHYSILHVRTAGPGSLYYRSHLPLCSNSCPLMLFPCLSIASSCRGGGRLERIGRMVCVGGHAVCRFTCWSCAVCIICSP